jgi:oligopeptide transport system substrate-binding protein
MPPLKVLLIASTLSAAPSPGQREFIYNNGPEPLSLDPALITGVPETRITYALFEGLTVPDARTGMPVPGLASSWKISRDLKTYTFTLRETTWSDGTPLTAQDVADAWMRVLDPRTGSPYAYLLGDHIEGADAYLKGKGPADKVQIHALDPRTFQVTFVGPLPYALAMLTHSAFVVTPTFAVRRYGRGAWTKPAHFIGNGPYVMKAWRPQDRVVVVRNPRYWDAANIKLDRITFLAVEDPNTAFQKYQAGEMDYATDDSIPAARIDEVRLRKDYHHMPGSTVYYYEFNVTRKPMDDVRVRKALAMALDRRELTDLVLKAGDVPTAGFVPAMGGYRTAKGNGYDPGRARELLAAAGYPGGKGFPGFTLIYNTSARHKTIGEWAQQSWKSVLGIDVELQNMEWNTYLETRQKTHDYQLARASWLADYPDPSNYLDMFVTGVGNNNSQYSDPGFDALMAQASVMPAGAARDGVMQRAETLLVDRDQAMIPLFFYSNKYLLDDRKWGGIHPNVIDIHHPRWWRPK